MGSTVHYWPSTAEHFVQQRVVHSVSSLTYRRKYLAVTSSNTFSLRATLAVNSTWSFFFFFFLLPRFWNEKLKRSWLGDVLAEKKKTKKKNSKLLTDILCPSPVVPSCSVNEYVCASGGCVSASLRCDGHDNCLDGSDEVSAAKTQKRKKTERCCSFKQRSSTVYSSFPWWGSCFFFYPITDQSRLKHESFSVWVFLW